MDESIYMHFKKRKDAKIVKDIVKIFKSDPILGKKCKIKGKEYYDINTMINDAPAKFINFSHFTKAFDGTLILEVAYPDTLDWRQALENIASVEKDLDLYDVVTVQAVLMRASN